MLNRLDQSSVIGGDSVQMRGTANALRELGISVDVGQKTRPLEEYDIVHIFNLVTYDSYVNAQAVREKGIPIILSSIYWPNSEFLRLGRAFTGARNLDPILRRIVCGPWARNRVMKSAFYAIRNTQESPGQRQSARTQEQIGEFEMRKSIIDSSVRILPNSVAEANQLKLEFGVPELKMVVVPNAVSDIFFAPASDTFDSGFGEEDHVLSVARIEDRKNTLSLIRACAQLDVPLVLVGQFHAKDRYVRACQSAAKGGRVKFFGPLPPESSSLVAAYTCARVHALVSWFETPGLSSLEAAAAGCTVVTTDRGSPKEYFHDCAYYADPGSTSSIETAIINALSHAYPDRRERLRDRLKSKYTWRNAASVTLECYEEELEHG